MTIRCGFLKRLMACLWVGVLCVAIVVWPGCAQPEATTAKAENTPEPHAITKPVEQNLTEIEYDFFKSEEEKQSYLKRNFLTANWLKVSSTDEYSVLIDADNFEEQVLADTNNIYMRKIKRLVNLIEGQSSLGRGELALTEIDCKKKQFVYHLAFFLRSETELLTSYSIDSNDADEWESCLSNPKYFYSKALQDVCGYICNNTDK